MSNVNKAFEELKGAVNGELIINDNGINILKKAGTVEATLLHHEIQKIMDIAKKYDALIWFDTNPSKSHYPGISVKIRIHNLN